MKFTIDTESIEKQGYSLNEVIALFCLEYTDIIPGIDENISESLFEKGLICSGVAEKINATPVGRNVLHALTFYKVPVVKRDTKSLAIALQAVFPEGRKGDTPYYWKGSTVEIQKKLDSFIKKYPNISNEDILEAATNYVKSFKGNYMYMQLLKYYIEKDGVSNLLASIENKDSHTVCEKEDWTSQLM